MPVSLPISSGVKVHAMGTDLPTLIVSAAKVRRSPSVTTAIAASPKLRASRKVIDLRILSSRNSLLC